MAIYVCGEFFCLFVFAWFFFNLTLRLNTALSSLFLFRNWSIPDLRNSTYALTLSYHVSSITQKADWNEIDMTG